MKNIFENAYFGKAYKTRDGRKAIYWRVINNDFPGIALLCEDFVIDVLPNGIVDESCFGDTFPNKHDYDIVSEWVEPIDEDKLDKLADEFLVGDDKEDVELLRDEHPKSLTFGDIFDTNKTCFKAGFRKAKEYIL